MDRTCIRVHDGNYPQEPILAFCTKEDCNKRFACGRCYQDYHSDHFRQLVSMKQFPAFLKKPNGQISAITNLLDELKIIQKGLIQTIQQLCENLVQQPIYQESDMTEETLNLLITGNQTFESRLVKIQDLISDFKYIDNALKSDIRMQMQTQIVKDRIYQDFTYSGEVFNNQMHGIGTANYADGSSYHGQWFQGQKCGSGLLKLKNGDWYEGEWKADKKHGQGTYQFANQSIYQGEWKEDKKHGRGVNKYVNGELYEGELKDNKKHGRGVYQFASGARYDGEWNEGYKHGQGIFKFVDGNVYDGEWVLDKRTGQGKLVYKNGNILIGEWNNSSQVGDHQLYEYKLISIVTFKDGQEIKKQNQ